MSTRSSSRLLAPTLGVATIAACAAVGVAPGLLTFAGTLALFSILAVALAAWLLRRSLILISARRRALDSKLDPGTMSVEPPVARAQAEHRDSELRFARALFYLGTLTIGEPIWRKGLTVSEAFFIGSFLCCAFSVRRGRAIVMVPALIWIGAGLFAFGAAISSIHAVSPARSVFNDAHGLYVLVIWVWTGAMVLRRREHLMMVLVLWSISLAFDGVGAMAQVFGLHSLAGAPVGGM